jgi:multisubunit Na+/H+ antiporter MnhC subunit
MNSPLLAVLVMIMIVIGAALTMRLSCVVRTDVHSAPSF